MTGRRRVLLADDREDVRELVAMTLGDDRFEILDAADGQTALHLARSHQPDVILLDVGMPGMDGFDVCRAIKGDAKTRHIPVYMLTAAGADSDRAAGDAAGASGYFTKPFSPVALEAEILRVTRREGEETPPESSQRTEPAPQAGSGAPVSSR